MKKTINISFGFLFFIVPLILWPYTSELFEFNKMVVVYLLTIAITAFWLIRMVSERKFIFRRTILDIPLLIFLGSQIISTLLSIDVQTSWLGYYSRFNGGLLSTICYLLLYWAFTSNIDRKDTQKLINTTLTSAAVVAFYGVLERAGIDKNIWQQDVQHRVFSTLGQPNWLAAWLVAILPLTWTQIVNKAGTKFSFAKSVPYVLSSLFFAVILFTGSRSGLLGLAVIEVIYWGVIFLKYKFSFIKQFIVLHVFFALLAGLLGTQVTPSIFKLFKSREISQTPQTVETGSTSLETGGTESGVIRKIVWQGAIDIWKHYPIFGTGVETFAYSYYMFRPEAHNLTSEWDFIYNKAHNEYLNVMANSGTVGILAYLTMVGFTILLISKGFTKKNDEQINSIEIYSIAFVSGYLSILVTNYFGFSVVPIQLLFYLFPAFAISLSNAEDQQKKQTLTQNSNQKLITWIILSGAGILTFVTFRYWYADHLYSTAVNYGRVNRYDLSPNYLNKAINFAPKQSLYYAELAKTYTNLALAYNNAKEATVASQLTEAAIDNSIKAVNLSPANVNLKRLEFGVFVMLATIDPNYLLDARDVLEAAIKQAPTDAKLFYNLGLIYSRTGQNDLALQALKKTVELKSNYKDARLAYAILLIAAKENSEAKIHLEYILANIDPKDTLAKQYLESIK